MTAPTAPALVEDAVEAVTGPGRGTEVEAVVEQDLLVEDVSIDGMCGVY